MYPKLTDGGAEMPDGTSDNSSLDGLVFMGIGVVCVGAGVVCVRAGVAFAGNWAVFAETCIVS